MYLEVLLIVLPVVKGIVIAGVKAGISQFYCYDFFFFFCSDAAATVVVVVNSDITA